MNVETEIAPEADHDGDDGTIAINLALTALDGTYRAAWTHVRSGEPEVIVEAIVEVVRGLAAMHGSDLQDAVARRLGAL